MSFLSKITSYFGGISEDKLAEAEAYIQSLRGETTKTSALKRYLTEQVAHLAGDPKFVDEPRKPKGLQREDYVEALRKIKKILGR